MLDRDRQARTRLSFCFRSGFSIMEVETWRLDTILFLLFVLLHPSRKGCSGLSIITDGQFHVFNEGDSVNLECSFRSDRYNMFDYPVIWRKQQMAEETQMNVMGSLNEPFVSSNRFEVTFTSVVPVYLVELSILDLIYEDSGNYTCEVRGPQSITLGQVTHHLFIRAPVERIIILDDGTPDQSAFSPSNVQLIENHPCRLRCIAVGGYPPPSLELFAGRRDVTSDFFFTHSASVTGTRGLRTMTYRTERWTNNYLPKAEDNDALFKCIASVPGLKPVVELTKLDVDFSPKISCTKGITAFIGDSDVSIDCHVSAKPSVSALFWIVDSNGTTLTEGDATDAFWSLNKERPDGTVDSHLYIRKVRPDSFRLYTMVAENNVAIAAKDVELKQRIKTTAIRPIPVSANSQSVGRSDASREARGHSYRIVEKNWALETNGPSPVTNFVPIVLVMLRTFVSSRLSV